MSAASRMSTIAVDWCIVIFARLTRVKFGATMSEFVEYLHEVFVEFGPIRSRKMFGGHGIYHHDLMFGLVADDELFLKTDKDNVAMFEELNLEPFEFETKDKVIKMSYYRAPEEIYDDPEVARDWANSAFDAALRANSKKK